MATSTDEAAAYDVVVIGGGFAGLGSAVRLVQGGARVLVLERGSEQRYACNSRITAGLFHCCGRPLDSDFGELDELIAERTEGRAVPELASAVSLDAMRLIGWLRDLGVPVVRGRAHLSYAHELQPPALTAAGYAWQGRGGDLLLQRLEAELTRAGSRLLRGHGATALVRRGGRIIGCRGRRADGSAFEVLAAATVLASGGFEADPALLRASVTASPDKLYPRHAGAGTGDAIRMARDAGAVTSTLGGFYGHVMSSAAFTRPALAPFPYLDAVLRAGIIVDAAGRRFADEGKGGTPVANAIAALPDPAATFVIADRKIWDICGRDPAMPHTAPNPMLIDGGGAWHQAGDLAGLARHSGIDAGGLIDTVEAHNRAVHEGRGAALQPPRSSTRWRPWPIRTPPFFAFPACAAITYTMDGVATNADAQALDPGGRPVPGLYAVGCASGGLEGGPAAGYVSGMLKAGVTALRAADAIARRLHLAQAA